MGTTLKKITFGSVCSGIEAASVAWTPLGWEAAWFSEIDKFPSALLEHHYPQIPNLGDMKLLSEKIRSKAAEAPDVFCGGTPCQAFSVAGKRKSLDDDRGNLSLIFCEVANEIDNVRYESGKQPCVIFWENVPGVLSTKDNAFGCFLAKLAGEDEPIVPSGKKWTNAGCVYGPKRAIAWRVLDAQYFGVAQRRRRVFVVASAREGFDPAEVLFEFNGLRRDIAPSREAGKETSGGFVPSLASCLETTSYDYSRADGFTAIVQPSYGIPGNWIGRKPENGGNATEPMHDIAPCLTKTDQHGVAQPIAFHPTQGPISNNDGTTHAIGCGSSGGQASVAICLPTYSIQGSMIGRNDNAGPQGDGINTEVSFTQNCVDRHAVAYGIRTANTSSNGCGIQEECTRTLDCAQGVAVAQPVAFQQIADCLTASYGTKWNGNASADNGSLFALGSAHPTVLMDQGGSVMNVEYNITGTLRRETHEHEPDVLTNMAVRRLTPVECEFLQGFPRDYTAIQWRKKPASECPDGPRYKALGNSWAVPVVNWIGKRINAALVDDIYDVFFRNIEVTK